MTSTTEKKVDDAKVETKAPETKPETKAKAEAKASKAQWYVNHADDVALAGGVVKVDTPFVSDTDKPGKDWEKITPKEAAAQEIAVAAIPSDEVFDAASDTALEAFVLIKGGDLRNLKGREALLAAAKSYNDPTR